MKIVRVNSFKEQLKQHIKLTNQMKVCFKQIQFLFIQVQIIYVNKLS